MSRFLADPILIAAALVMLSFAALPKRYRHQQLLMIIGWAAVWLDNEFTGHWLDWTGGLVVVAALGLILRTRCQTAGHHS